MQLESSGCPCEGEILRRHATLRIRESERHFWSPQLSIELRERDGGCLINARFGPHDHVWTMFIAMYATAGFAAVCGLMYGAAQVTMGAAPSGLLVVPVAVIASGLVYGAALIGQAIGEDQMDTLHGFLDAAIGEHAERH